MFLEIFFTICGIVLLCIVGNKIKICIDQKREREQVIPMPRMVVPSPLVANDIENQPH